MNYFHPFVIPFCIGVILLFTICAIKYFRWIRQLDRMQRAIVRRNIFTWRFLPAIKEAIVESLFHRKLFKKNLLLGYMHCGIALGWFLLIVVGAIECELAVKEAKPLWTSIFFRYFVTDTHTFHHALFFTNLMDALLLWVLSSVLIAVIKRVWVRIVGIKKATKHVIFDRFALIALWLIFPLRLLSESLTAAVVHNGGFATQALGNLIHPEIAAVFETTSWTLYSLALCTFFVAMPFSRYMHIFTEILLIYFRKLGVKENQKSSGYTKIELSACSRCGICIDGCPIHSELKINNIQSVYLLRDIRYKKLSCEVADNCLMCERCVTDCPVGIELTQIRRQKRNKGVIDTHDNYKYAANIKSFNAIGRVIYFAGCMTHLTPAIIEAMKTIFETSGQKYWFMDEDKTLCCGRPLIQQGFSNQAAELRRLNSGLITRSGATMLVTSCPICYRSFNQEYKLQIPVMHHTEYIQHLIKTGKLHVTNSTLTTAYHDPCELGRGCGIYKAPRQVLKSVSKPVKVTQAKAKSICCGHNLGDTVLEVNQQSAIRNAALANLAQHNPDIIVTACPMCKKSMSHACDYQVKDIAEIVAMQLKRTILS